MPDAQASPQRNFMPSESRQTTPSTRPPTAREMQEHFQQYRKNREDVWRTRARPESFTFGYDDSDTDNARPGLSAKSAGFDRPTNASKEKIPLSSTWSPSSQVDPTLSPNHAAGDKDRLYEADELEKEYAKLTSGNLNPAKANALMNVKRLQELRRRKLEALTARVVENRRRLAQEVKTADRPLEISFVDKTAGDMKVKGNSKVNSHPKEIYFNDTTDSREEHQSSRAPKGDTRDSPRSRGRKRRDSHFSSQSHRSLTRESRKPLAVLEEIEEPASSEERSDSNDEGADEEPSNSSEHFGYPKNESSGARSEPEAGYGKEENTSEGKESTRQDMIIDLPPNRVEDGTDKNKQNDSQDKQKDKSRSNSKDRKQKARSKSRDRKGEKKAKDLVEKLREKRSMAKEAHTRLFVPPTYTREDVLTAVESGKATVTLPSRDPKLARKNRKLHSAKLVESSRKDEKKHERISVRGMNSKIATKKSSKVELEGPGENEVMHREAPMPGIQLSDHWDIKNHLDTIEPPRHQSSHRKVEKKSKGDKRTSSGMSVMSDLSESAYGVASYTGSEFGIEEISEDYGDADREDSRNSETTTSGDIDIAGMEEDPFIREKGEVKEDKSRKPKIGELQKTAMAEGFEIEEGCDLNSMYSTSAYSKYMEENPDTSDETYQETMKGLKALHELEKRLDEQDRKSVMPELLELTQLHSWNMSKVIEHFIQLFPQAVQGVNMDALMMGQLMNATDMDINPLDPTSRISLPPSTRKLNLVNQPPDDELPLSAASSLTSGWRDRIRASSSRRAVDHDSSIDMSDLRTSLRSISRRQRRGRRGAAFQAGLSILDEH
jgi:hypothetical protein